MSYLYYDSLWEVFRQCHGPEDQLEEHEGQDEGYLALDRKARMQIVERTIKGTVSGDFRVQVFSWISFPQAPSSSTLVASGKNLQSEKF